LWFSKSETHWVWHDGTGKWRSVGKLYFISPKPNDCRTRRIFEADVAALSELDARR
jgi:hypothetical protein